MSLDLKAYAQLARPANLPTAAADILAGAAIAGSFLDQHLFDIGWPLAVLVLSSVFLYAGGVILNDVFDVQVDGHERPERPIPSGRVSLRGARFFGFSTLFTGALLAFFVSTLSGSIALLLALSILAYDAYSKKFDFLGPLNMGLCRGLNLVLGMSVLGVPQLWHMGAIPLVYIFAITMISRGEVHGDNKRNIALAGSMYLLVLVSLGIFAQFFGNANVITWAFLAVFAIAILVPLARAYQKNTPSNIKKAVKMGILALVLMDATMTALFSNWQDALLVLALLPISMALSKLFAVT